MPETVFPSRAHNSMVDRRFLLKATTCRHASKTYGLIVHKYGSRKEITPTDRLAKSARARARRLSYGCGRALAGLHWGRHVTVKDQYQSLPRRRRCDSSVQLDQPTVPVTWFPVDNYDHSMYTRKHIHVISLTLLSTVNRLCTVYAISVEQKARKHSCPPPTTVLTVYPDNIPGTCKIDNQFDCGVDNGGCIALSNVRDCLADCLDGIDESERTHAHTPTHVQSAAKGRHCAIVWNIWR